MEMAQKTVVDVALIGGSKTGGQIRKSLGKDGAAAGVS